MNKTPIDVIQLIGLYTNSTNDYLSLALCCKHHLKLLKNYKTNGEYTGLRKKALNYFTIIIYDTKSKYGTKSKTWCINGKLHREDGPAIEWDNGSMYWYINGECHREDGPALETSDGDKWWYINGNFHREDGPAVEYSNGDKWWFINGQMFSEEKFNQYIIEKNENSIKIC